MKNKVLIFCAVLLAGCSTGIVPMGRETFMVSQKGSVYSTVGSLKAKCLKQANAYCENKGLSMVIVSTSGHDGGFGVMGTCELEFLAVPKSDPRNQNPTLKRAPDSVNIIKYGE